MKPNPAPEEQAFRQAELDLLIRQYRLENFGDAFDRTLSMLNQLIREGVIDGGPGGLQKGLEMIVKADPAIEDTFMRFASAVADKTVDEIKQQEKPN